MIDLDAIRSSIIANAVARQAASETAKTLQISNEIKKYSRKANSISAIKARILFFSQSKKHSHENIMQGIVYGPFCENFKSKLKSKNVPNSNCEDAVNLNGSNNVKSSTIEKTNGNEDIVTKHFNSSVNRG